MSKKITDAYLRSIKPTGEKQIVTIGDGLSLWVQPSGIKVFYLRYTVNGKRQNVSIGEYPSLTLKQAMLNAENLKREAKEKGVNIAEERKRKQQQEEMSNQHTFKYFAELWLAQKKLSWSKRNYDKQQGRLYNHLYYTLADKPVHSIMIQDIILAVQPSLNKKSFDTAKRVLDIARSVFEYIDLLGYLEDYSLIAKIEKYKKEVPTQQTKNLYVHMSNEEIGSLLFLIEENKFRWTVPVSAAIRLAPYVFVRPSELCEALWEEIDLDRGEWVISAERMKMSREHIVPLSRQAIALFEEIKEYSNDSRYVFKSRSYEVNKPITTASLIGCLRRMGYRSTNHNAKTFVTHAFRGLASTTLYQSLKYPSDYIELQLAHVEKNKIKAAYNQITSRSFFEERREMMQKYADYLDTLREQAKNSQ